MSSTCSSVTGKTTFRVHKRSWSPSPHTWALKETRMLFAPFRTRFLKAWLPGSKENRGRPPQFWRPDKWHRCMRITGEDWGKQVSAFSLSRQHRYPNSKLCGHARTSGPCYQMFPILRTRPVGASVVPQQLSSCLRHQHPVSKHWFESWLLGFRSSSLLTVLWKAAEDSLSALVELLTLGFGLAQPL